MKILRVLNNNVVLSVREDGTEVVLTGWGLGFQGKPGQIIDEEKIQQVFVPENNRDTDHMAQLLAAVPLDYLQLADELITEFGGELRIERGSATVVALADHLQMAVRRNELAPEETAKENPLTPEVAHLYPQEYAIAGCTLHYANDWLSGRGHSPLPPSETTAVTLHLVNAGFRTEDLAGTYLMTGVFSQLFGIIDSTYGITLDRNSVNAARFITHMRYFFVRAHKDEQLDEGMSVLRDSLEQSHPEAVNCADRLAAVLELRLGVPLTADEVAYLALHVARLAVN